MSLTQSAEEDDLQVCEACDARHTIEAMTPTDDGCYLCPACQAKVTELFNACTHEWQPSHDQFGEEAHSCERCSHIVCDVDFPTLFGIPAPARTGEAA